ncbi:MAG TPA: DUF6252 family protein [Petrimonas sp.]|nr:DUF6252 family protein [Petrimonas sp.]
MNKHIIKNKSKMKNVLKTMLLLLAILSANITSVNAQKSSSKGLRAKIGNTTFKSENCLAFWNSNNEVLLIVGVNKNEKISIHLKSEGRVYEKGFTIGEYYFARNTQMLENYSVNATYSNGDTDWKDNDDEERTVGKIQITDNSKLSVCAFYAVGIGFLGSLSTNLRSIKKVAIRYLFSLIIVFIISQK